MKKLLILAVIAIAAAAAWYGLNANNRQAASPDTTPTTQQKQNNTASIKPTGENEISIQNFSYSPASLTVKKGKAVKWINQDSVPHTVTESDGKSGPDSPPLAAGQSYSFTFSQTGVFHYRCTLHSNMTGVITVVD
jgi:plastocyanin